jgi:hypothetical protein
MFLILAAYVHMQRVCAGAATMCSECVQVQRLCACEYAASVCRCSEYVLEEGMAVRITTNPYRGKTGVITDTRSKLPQPNGRTYWNIRLDVGNGSKRGPIIYKMEKNLTKCSTG